MPWPENQRISGKKTMQTQISAETTGELGGAIRVAIYKILLLGEELCNRVLWTRLFLGKIRLVKRKLYYW